MIGRQVQLADAEVRKWKLDKGTFYRGKVLHSVIDSRHKKPPGFISRIMSVKLSSLCLFDDSKDESPLVHLRAHKVTKTLAEPDFREIKISYSAGVEGNEELHTLKFADADEYERWFYALQYAGFIKHQSEGLQREGTTKFLVDIFVPNGIGPDGAPTPTEQQNALVSLSILIETFFEG
ncbi:hypothetical protein IE077_001938 [Cardiosporidium cionae]|uniref:PH domain-containing protein n=1 Tax=Cardiosporidium cionae TaxID=476202 RepID=A0ABQ7JBY7_9APIC|nr:hypothetical protein IE077_001938 [Cardiosporidium cionae]|eukprot:KAF8821518.1 hypothetical protein IE077_001938 [Cardiosporidium cionae]